MTTFQYKIGRPRSWAAALLVVVLAMLPACGSGGGEAGFDAGGDAGPDAGGDASGDEAPALLHSVTVEELRAALADKDFLLINVHVPREGEIPGTDTHIAYTDIDALAAYIGPLDTETVLYCKTDKTSLLAGQALVERGYSRIYYLEGGMNAWQAAGYQLDP